MSVLVTVVIPTYNEERNIRHAIESVLWTKNVFVVDSFSTDKTVEIAKKYAPKVEVVQHEWEGYARQKNWALDNLPFSTEWVMFLDADEVVTEKPRSSIKEEIDKTEHKGYYIPMRYVFLGKWLKHAAGYPQYKLILFNRHHAKWEEREVHEHPIVSGDVSYLTGDIIHQDRKPLRYFFDRHNRYADMEAREQFKLIKRSNRTTSWPDMFSRGKRKRFLKESLWLQLPVLIRPFVRFAHLYFFKLGFLDGVAGLAYCLAALSNQIQISLKLVELKKTQKRN